MKKYTTILWDLDQTILDFARSQDYALRYTFRQFGREIGKEEVSIYAAINDEHWKRMERGEITKQEVLLGRFLVLFEKLGIAEIAPEAFGEIYQEALGDVFFFLDEADRLIIRLREKGYKQYIVTNGVNRTQAKKVRLSGLDKMVDGVFVSELMGFPKPRKEYFDACFARLAGVSREECLLVGDSITSDMQGGINAGIDVCWYNPERQNNPSGLAINYEIRHLQELLQILSEEEKDA
ncbi:MAG: YjjG family noncanonical pyrimidine nucleotidase [Blautia sp.]|nr:YjjG family noncanonical pyrimidine nucleotidase [Blautia sp.]MCM1200636.1 YjjG family noncanonical pyrimidine nucleotidase [Bacteroides fragilis]